MTSPLVGVPEPVTVRVPAKINLHLTVGPLQADGFHSVVTIFQAVSLFDLITVTPAHELSVSVRGEGAGQLPVDSNNLAWKAAVLMAERAGVAPMLHVDLTKSIPVAAGLAGGSADAAGTLVACDALWGVGAERAELLELASALGSDVAFALTGGTALGTGRGEQLAPVLAGGRWHWVLAIAHNGLSTVDVYREIDRLRLEREQPTESSRSADGLIEALRSGNPRRLGELLHNDLRAAALSLRPELRRTLRAGLELGALGATICGSGPTCAFLAESSDDAVRLAAALAGAGVCDSVRVAHGPVVGARVIDNPGG